MNSCPHCSGELLRHGVTHYKRTEMVGIRYRCKDCSRTFTQRMNEDKVSGVLCFGLRGFPNLDGRPTLKDWRFAA